MDTSRTTRFYKTDKQNTYMACYFYCRDKIRDKYQDFYTAFRKYDTKKKGSLSVNEIQRVLNDLNFFMNDEEFFRLMDS